MHTQFSCSTVKTFISQQQHAYKLLQGHCRTDVRRHFFTERVIKIWNNLPANETDFYTVKAFSNFLNKLDLHNYLYT
jgi:hypothetical protein